MSEKEMVFSSKIKNSGIASFKDYYKFCYDWLSEETDLIVAETKYVEKLEGNSKSIDIVWEAFRKLTDYFKFEAQISFKIIGLTEVEIEKNGKKIKTNKGSIETKAKGVLVRDYDGKFEQSAFKKFLRGIYEKWVIPSRIDQFEDKIIGDLDEFLDQAKAWLDLEGRKGDIILT